jgi:hypothetical protein
MNPGGNSGYLFRRENTHGISIFFHGHTHFGEDGFAL